MKELHAVARNIRMFYVEGEGLVPELEVVLTLSEINRDFVGGTCQSVRKLDTIRMAMSPKAARQVAKNLNEWADETEKVKAEFVVEHDPAESGGKDGGE